MNVILEPEDQPYSSQVVSVLKKALSVLGQTKHIDLEVNFLSEEEIRELNRTTRGVDRVTDVLSYPGLDGILGRKLKPKDFPLDTDPETGNLFLGSIAICSVQAERQSEEYGHSAEREMGYLAVHGLLHLLGYDHETDEDKRRMRALEEKILSAVKLARKI